MTKTPILSIWTVLLFPVMFLSWQLVFRHPLLSQAISKLPRAASRPTSSWRLLKKTYTQQAMWQLILTGTLEITPELNTTTRLFIRAQWQGSTWLEKNSQLTTSPSSGQGSSTTLWCSLELPRDGTISTSWAIWARWNSWHFTFANLTIRFWARPRWTSSTRSRSSTRPWGTESCPMPPRSRMPASN